MRNKLYLLIIIIGLIAGIVVFAAYVKPKNFSSTNESIYQDLTEAEILTEEQKIELIAGDVSRANDYIGNNIYDCTDFTISLAGNLTKEGYDAYCVVGDLLNSDKKLFHAWVEVNLSGEIIWIESITGRILDEEHKLNYKFKERPKKCY